MDEIKNNHKAFDKSACAICASNMCPCGVHCSCTHKYIFARWILGILILALVFCIGMKIGELRGLLEANGYGERHSYMMMQNGYGNPQVYPMGSPNMMRFQVIPPRPTTGTSTQ